MKLSWKCLIKVNTCRPRSRTNSNWNVRYLYGCTLLNHFSIQCSVEVYRELDVQFFKHFILAFHQCHFLSSWSSPAIFVTCDFIYKMADTSQILVDSPTKLKQLNSLMDPWHSTRLSIELRVSPFWFQVELLFPGNSKLITRLDLELEAWAWKNHSLNFWLFRNWGSNIEVSNFDLRNLATHVTYIWLVL